MTQARPEQLRLIDCAKKFGGFGAVNGLSFAAGKGEFICILGPSGCGKTTTLRMIAGLERPSAGEMMIGGRTVFSARGGAFIPPQGRNLGMVFQSYALWPHLSVFGNVAYPLRARGLSRREIARRVGEKLELVELAAIASRYPHQLSGGQQQRVALARALIYEPDLLLLDEPLANLDRALRDQMRIVLKHLLRRLAITTIFVTHDQLEAFTLADRILLMRDGRLVQDGTPGELYGTPVNAFAAEFTGSVNAFSGHVVERRGAAMLLRLAPDMVIETARPLPAAAGAAVRVVMRPQHLTLWPAAPAARPNLIAGRVEEACFLGEHTEYVIAAGALRFRITASHLPPRAPGDDAWLAIDPADVLAFPDDAGSA